MRKKQNILTSEPSKLFYFYNSIQYKIKIITYDKKVNQSH